MTVHYNRLKYFDIIVFVMAIIVGLGILSYPITYPTPRTDYIPNAVTGLTTLSGILIAFIGLWLSRIYAQPQFEKKIWTIYRLLISIAVVFNGLIFVMIGVHQLVFGSLLLAYESALFGTMLMALLLFDTSVMMAIEATSKISVK